MQHFSLLVLMLLLFAGAASAQPSQLSVEQIMDQMLSVYASGDSYVDEGEVKTLYIRQNGNRTVLKPFTTAYVRPSNFRFEYQDRFGEYEWNNYIIWHEADVVKTWWSIKPIVLHPENLTQALLAATGVSSLSSLTIPALLIPEMGKFNRFQRLTKLNLIGEEKINGNLAYKIEATQSDKNQVTLWIDKNSLLIVKLFQITKFGQLETASTTTYKPQINTNVAKGKLTFNAPE